MADICGSVSLFPFCMAYPDSCVSGSGKRIKAVGVTGRITGKSEVMQTAAAAVSPDAVGTTVA
jgi:hypothetical protein